MSFNQPRIDRRAAIKWMLAAAATVSLRDVPAQAAPPVAGAATGYGQDPDLLRDYKPGDLWPLTFTAAQRRSQAGFGSPVVTARLPVACEFPDTSGQRGPVVNA